MTIIQNINNTSIVKDAELESLYSGVLNAK